jgi:hypothetical protein
MRARRSSLSRKQRDDDEYHGHDREDQKSDIADRPPGVGLRRVAFFGSHIVTLGNNVVFALFEELLQFCGGGRENAPIGSSTAKIFAAMRGC